MAQHSQPGATHSTPLKAAEAAPSADTSLLTASSRAPDQPAALDLAGLVAAHHAAVYRYAYRLCGCPTEAEDLTQQTFLVAQRKLSQLREAERACSWLLAVVRSCFLKSIRRTRPVAAQDLELDVNEIADNTPEVDEIDREQLAAAMAELPDEFRLVVLMFYFEELSYQQVAEELEIPIGTVMSRLSRAKRHLRRRLAPEPESSASDSNLNHRPTPRRTTKAEPRETIAKATR